MSNITNIILKNIKIPEKFNYKLILISIFSVLFFFIFNKYLSYKIAYGAQLIIALYLLIFSYNTKLNKLLLVINLPVLFILFFGIEKQTFYLISLSLLNLFIFDKFNKKEISLDLKYLYIFFSISSLVLTAHYSTVNETNIIQDIVRSLYKWQYFDRKYGILSLNPGMTGMILSTVSLLFVKKLNKKNFYIYFTIITILIFTITGSKASLLFCLIALLCSIKFVTKKILIFTFFLLSISACLAGLWVVKNLPNPYVNEEEYLNKIEYNRDDMYIQAIPYYQEICPRIQNNFVKLLTECDSSPFEIGNSMSKIYSNNFFIRFIYKFKIFGFSSYYKFYTYGASVEYILKNPKMFLFPNPLKKAKEKKLVGDYQLSSHFASHSAFIGIFQHFGIIYGLLFLFNIIYFLYNSKDKLVFPIFIASAFFTIDIILLFPIIILNNVITDKKFISK